MRVSAFKQIQAISHQLSVLSSGRHNVNTLCLPSDFCVRPVAENEVRVVRKNGDEHRSFLFVKKHKTYQRVIPDVLPDSIPLCTLGLDQGSIGTAGVAFAIFVLFRTMWPKFDKVHRLIRDLALSMKH